ncbi:MAG: methyltransferase domain-containing protein [Candidatus Hodarchaeota archaeon]
MIKLNLGCGLYYKTGYINIDSYERSIGDITADIRHLPFKNDSIDEIEASHVLEHFDGIILPYLLSEWYRILKPLGELHIETPHLVKTIKKLRFSNYSNQKRTLRFLFGVDIPGNFHKFGFTPSFLKKTLREIGFYEIKEEKPLSFKKEKGLRMKAIKPTDDSPYSKTVFLTKFRWKILANLLKPHTQLLDAIETNCFDPLMKMLPANVKSHFDTTNIVSNCATFAILNPKVAKIFLSLFLESKIRGINSEVLDFLHTHKSPALFLANWAKWRKDPSENYISIVRFYSHWSKKISQSMTTKDNFEEKFSYLLTLPKEDQDFFSIETINLHALKLINRGIKAFFQKKFNIAKELFRLAIKYDPTNGFAYWNLARLDIQLNGRREKIKEYYLEAAANIHDRRKRRDIKREMKTYLRNGIFLAEITPVQTRN